jgi:hypothetical protein
LDRCCWDTIAAGIALLVVMKGWFVSWNLLKTSNVRKLQEFVESYKPRFKKGNSGFITDK